MKFIHQQTYRFALMIALIADAGCLFGSRDAQGQIDARRDDLSLRDALAPIATSSLPAGIRIVRDVAYGGDTKQRFDVYAPAQTKGAPVIFMVHGGGWAFGDKAARNVVENKVKRWVPRGCIVISVNNRLLPIADPLEQARDVARALAFAQHKVIDWGGDPGKFILMGHSAGAHLIALLSASPNLGKDAGARPWLGSVLLDSAALDVPQIMRLPHLGLYDRAFGKGPAEWKTASPFEALSVATPPILAVCSSRRRVSCPQAQRFVSKASLLGSRASVLEENLSHAEINQQLGSTGLYTDAVETFLRSLDRTLAQRLANDVPPAP